MTGLPLVATSGNASDEPMPIDNDAARIELGAIADAFLLHDRRILRHADDSVVRLIGGRPVPIRIGRGLAPVRIVLPFEPPPLLATGGHLKAAVAFTRGHELFLGQHIGDLDTLAVRERYVETLADLTRLFGVRPRQIVHDAHPDYFTTRYAEQSGLPRLAVQHHHAHIMACLAEHGEHGPALGIAWDGTGYGDDGTIWGGEFLMLQGPHYRRVGSLWPFRLVGGDRACASPDARQRAFASRPRKRSRASWVSPRARRRSCSRHCGRHGRRSSPPAQGDCSTPGHRCLVSPTNLPMRLSRP